MVTFESRSRNTAEARTSMRRRRDGRPIRRQRLTPFPRPPDVSTKCTIGSRGPAAAPPSLCSPRRVANAMLLFFASLAVGKACELAFSAETLSAALRAQARGIEAVRSLTPLSLTTGYVSDLGAAGVGDLVYRPPPVVAKPKLRHPNREEAARYGACQRSLRRSVRRRHHRRLAFQQRHR